LQSTAYVLDWLPGRFAVVRLDPVAAPGAAPWPSWFEPDGALVSVTRTERECSIIAPEVCVPASILGSARCERGFRAIAVAGPLGFGLVGLLARLTRALAYAEIPALAISTFDTDVLLVRDELADRAGRSLLALPEVSRIEPAESGPDGPTD